MNRVLIVEDEPATAEMLELVCSLAGVESRIAANGEAALAALNGFAADLILTDFMMPVMDGCEFVRVIRGDPVRREVPIIMMTAAPDVAARRCSGETILAKPIDVDALSEMLQRLRTSA